MMEWWAAGVQEDSTVSQRTNYSFGSRKALRSLQQVKRNMIPGNCTTLDKAKIQSTGNTLEILTCPDASQMCKF